ncbi:hypothetical protein ACJMK2_013147 [Sinanodonta woodiana]|uniref:G-protein coupled receptors family 1 profile domain-containing protein n=1 Tax=Sinanodonta woodiana TaxID=1069815 RepID=A0ABD3VDD9_SINWO
MDENASYVQHDDPNTIIHIINDNKVLENLSGIVFISMLMIVGIPGNTTALYVYVRKFKPSPYRTFVVCLAIVDLAACCIAMPFVIVRLRYPVVFTHDKVCKVFHLLSHIPCVSSVLILITIAVERYRKICVPHGIQMSDRMAKYICIIDIIVACCLSSPAAVVYGKRSIKLEVNYINGTSCSWSDSLLNTKYPHYFNLVLYSGSIASIIALIIIYSLIGKEIFRMKKTGLGSNQLQTCQNYTVRTETIEIAHVHSEANERDKYVDGREKEYTRVDLDAIKQWYKKNYKAIRITRIIIVITVVFACSFLPRLTVGIITALEFDKVLLKNISFPGRVAYHMFVWTFFISNVVNPIIYGFNDRKFKDEICRLYKSFCGICFTSK